MTDKHTVRAGALPGDRLHNGDIARATTIKAALPPRPAPAGGLAALLPPRVVGAAALATVATACLLLASAAAGTTDGVYLPGGPALWPATWSSPLAALGLRLSDGGLVALTVALVVAYGLLLACARALPLWLIVATLALCYGLLASGPPLFSRDIFGYIAYARMAAIHGLNPYTQVPAQMAGDPLLAFVGWPHQHTPYGPLFTALTLPLALLGPTAAYWALKGLCAGAALLAVAALAHAARRRGADPRPAAVLLGANPAFLVLLVGGDHNDSWVLAATCLGLALLAGRPARPRAGAAALVAATALKLSAGLAPLFAWIAPQPLGRSADGNQRQRLRRWTLIWAAVLAVGALAGFGSHAFGFLLAIGAEQQIVSPHSLPSELAILLGLGWTPAALRDGFLAAYALLLVGLCARCLRGWDWVGACGWAYCGLLAASAWLVPWYTCWPLPFAALAGNRRLTAVALGFSAYGLCFHLPWISALLGSPAAPVKPRHF